MNGKIRTYLLKYGILVVTFSWLISPYKAIAKSYPVSDIKIDVVGSQISMSGVHSIKFSDWTRFDIAIGVIEARIESGDNKPKTLPVSAIEDWQSNSAYLTISLAVRPIKKNDDSLTLEIIQQTGIAPGLDSDDLNSISNWKFAREIKEIAVAIDSAYEFELDDPFSSGRYRIRLTISGQYDFGKSSSSSRDQLRNALDNANFTIQHSLERDSLIGFITDMNGWVKSSVHESIKKKTTPMVDPAKLIDIDIQSDIEEILDNAETVKSDRVHHVEFADTIKIDDDYYCYHQVKLTLSDMEATMDYNVLYATLKISRNTIFSQGQATSSTQVPIAKIMNDIFERRIRLFKGNNTNIQILDEDSLLPLPMYESFNITAEW